MVDVRQVPAELVPDAFQLGGDAEERLPVPQAVATIFVMAMCVWGAIGVGVGWLVS